MTSSRVVKCVVGAAAVLAMSGCPADPGPLPVDPLACTRTDSVIFTAPTGRSVTQPRVSADGRFVLYRVDDGTGMPVSEDFGIFGPKSFNVYQFDRATSTTVRVNPAGTTARLASTDGAGRFVAYSTPVGPDYPSREFAIDVWDRVTGTTERITSTTGNSTEPSISADGRFVAFMSTATDLVTPADVNTNTDIFVHDRQTGSTTRLTDQSSAFVSMAPLFGDTGLRISGDGSTVIAAIARPESNETRVVVIDRASGATTVPAAAPLTATSPSGAAVTQLVLPGGISNDGNTFSFSSSAPFVASDDNGSWDAYLYDRTSGSLTQLTDSTYIDPAVSPPASNYSVGLSADGAIALVVTNMADPTDGVTAPPVLVSPGDPWMYGYRRASATLSPLSTSYSAAASGDLTVLVGTSGGKVLSSVC